MKITRSGFLALISLLIISCGKEEENTADQTFGIRHDKSLVQYEAVATNDSPYEVGSYPDFSPVVAFSYSLDGSKNFQYVASGVLISDQWILTAGHNFFVSSDQSEPAKVSGIEVLFGNDPNDPDLIAEVEKLEFHPTWLTDDDLYGTANDLCLVKLNSPVNNYTPAMILDENSEVIGNSTWYCGFGDYSETAGQDKDLYSLKHAIENILDRKVGGITTTASNGNSYTGGLLAFDFDSPDGTVNTLGDDYASEDENLLGGGSSSSTAMSFEGGTVEGDSGGPLFMQIDGTWQVCGILSGGIGEPIPDYIDGNYGDISVFIRTALAYDWIASVVDLNNPS